MKILIAEDNSSDRLLLQHTLENWGHEVVSTVNGAEALEALKGNDISLLITDWMMPVVNGVELVRQVRAAEWDRYIYILMLTSMDAIDDIAKALETGADDFVTKPFNRVVLRARIQVAERVISLERDLAQRIAELEGSKTRAELLLASMSYFLIEVDSVDNIIEWDKGAEDLLDIPRPQTMGQPFSRFDFGWDADAVFRIISECRHTGKGTYLNNVRFTHSDGKAGFLSINVCPISDEKAPGTGFLLLARDVTEHKVLEEQLAQAQKLESIGQLAAGIAHEINTPIQYVGDNSRFLQESCPPLFNVLEKYGHMLDAAKQENLTSELIAEVEASVEEADIEYLLEEIPVTLEQSLEGLGRIANIVRAMKEFSHPGGKEKSAIDINRAIENTITIARNEWKYVADVVTELDPSLPLVHCLEGEIKQVFLNLIMNGAHAIRDVLDDDSTEKGRITVSTLHNGSCVEIRVSDTGTGIPKEIRHRVFDSFFTTKEVGKGTGQGLTIAYNVVVNKHDGKIDFETEPGKGTTFIIDLPVEG